jgi:hypothetical protein
LGLGEGGGHEMREFSGWRGGIKTKLKTQTQNEKVKLETQNAKRKTLLARGCRGLMGAPRTRAGPPRLWPYPWCPRGHRAVRSGCDGFANGGGRDRIGGGF